MYPLDMFSLPGFWLRRTRLWYARGRTWQRTAGGDRRAAPVADATPQPPAPAHGRSRGGVPPADAG
jgi:hypothetical protein